MSIHSVGEMPPNELLIIVLAKDLYLNSGNYGKCTAVVASSRPSWWTRLDRPAPPRHHHPRHLAHLGSQDQQQDLPHNKVKNFFQFSEFI